MKPRTVTLITTGIMMILACANREVGLISNAYAQEGGSASAPSAPPARSEVAEEHRWNLADIFQNTLAWEAGFNKTEGMIEQLAALKGTIGKSPENLLKALKHRDVTFAGLDRLVLYAGLSYHQDMSVDETQGRWDRVQTLATKAAEASSWFVPEILTLPLETVSSWLDKNKDLAVYRHATEDIHRQRAHFLSPREEELLAMAGEIAAAPGNIYGRFTNTNLDFPVIKDAAGNDVQVSSAKYYELIYSPDRRVRRDVFLGLHQTYLDKQNTLSALLSAQVKQHIFFAKARHHDSSLRAALDGPNIPAQVYDNLVATVNKHLPKLHRYVDVRRKVMGLEELHRYDLRVPMLAAPDEKIPYEDAVATILKALRPLGEDYVGTLRTAFESRWIDVYETQDKRSGAYCWGTYLTHPYLLLNYHGTRNDRSTVAHEMGHAMHSWYSHRTQPMVYGDYATFCAEVASTVNEVLLSHHLLKNVEDDAAKLLILQEQIEGIRTTVFRQTMFAEFEKAIHEMAESGKPLTGDVLCKTYGDLVRKYYGPKIVLEDCATAECLRIPHFYRNFYVYNYATSHCAATNIGRRIINREPGAVEGLMKFLSAGSSLYPLDILNLAGVDMTTPKPIEDTMELFEKLLEEFEALYAKQSKT